MVRIFTRQIFCIYLLIAATILFSNNAYAKNISAHKTLRSSIENALGATPTITFNATLGAKPYGSADFVAATSTSRAPMTFTSSNPAVATIVNGKVHITGLGSSTITLNQDANSQYDATTANATLSVIQGTPVITFTNNLSPKAYTTTDFAAATATLGAPITYTTDNSTVATIINNNIHLVSTGTVNITATIPSSAQYAGASSTLALSVQKSTPAITFIAGLNAKQYTTTDFLPATVLPAVPVTYTSDNPAVATIINNKVHLMSTGSANITATITGTDLYNGATQTISLTVLSATPVITFADLSAKQYTTTNFSPATVAPAVPVIYTSDNPAVATIINNTVHLVDIGSANITGTIAATSTYSGTSNTATLNVIKATPTITFASTLNAKPFTTTNFAPATISPAVPVIYSIDNPAVATIINNTVHLTGVGTANITATIAGTDLYNGVTQTASLSVVQATPVISFIAGLNAKAFTTTNFTPATSNPALPIVFTSSDPSVATIINNTVHLINTGTTTITATIAGNALYSGAIASTTLNVTQATPVISFIAGLNAKAFTTTDFAPASSNPALPITYTSDNTAVATIVNNLVNIVGAGTTNITATIEGTPLYNGATATTPLTVKQATPIISFIAGLNAKPFTTTNFAPATVSPVVPVTYTSDNPAVATIINNQVHLVAIGTANITATVDGSTSNGLYNSTTATIALTVVQATPVISFIAGLNAKQYTTTNFAPATVSPVLPITYTSDNPAVATIVNNQVDIIGLGTANITASIDGSASGGLYSSTTATAPLTVIQATPVISFIAGLNAKPFATTDFIPASSNPVLPITYSIDPSEASVATIVNNQVHLVGTGSATITATINGSSTNLYNGTSSTSPLVVTKSAPVITFAAGLSAKPYGSADFVPATAAPVVPITYQSSDLSVATIVNGKVHIVGLGSTTITATIADNPQYSGTSSSTTLTVSTGTPTITFAATLSPRFYGSGNFIPATATLGAPITYTLSNNSVVSISATGVAQIIGVGTVTITATTPSNSFYVGASTSATVTINQSTPVISFIAGLDPKPYTAVNFAAATATYQAPITYTSDNPAVATIVNNMVHLVGLGTANITATTPNNAFYVGQTANTLINVVRSSPVITFAATFSPKIYGNANFTPATATYGAPITLTSDNPAIATIVNGQVHIVAPGSANITATTPDNTLFAGATATLLLQVDKITPTLTFAQLPSKTFGDAPIILSATPSNNTIPVIYSSDNSSIASISGNTLTITGAGIANITASQAGNDFYKPVSASSTFSVNRADQFITFAPLTAKTYGDADFTLNASITTGTVSYTSSNTAVATITGNTVHIVGAGTSNITASQTADNNHNDATPVSQQLTVNMLGQTISFDPLTDKAIGDANFNLSASATSGLGVTFTSSNTSVATVTGSSVTIVGIGTTVITASQAGNNNYSAAEDFPQTLNVGKASQNIAFNALAGKLFADADFDLTATASSGLSVSYASSNNAVATINGNTVHIVGIGTTTITASQYGDDTYNAATDAAQELSVGKATQTITFNSPSGKSFGDPNFDLNASASSNLPVSYTSSNTAVATVSGNTVTIIGAGSANITASQSGDDNYNAATSIQQPLSVSKTDQTITFSTLPSKVVGDVNFDLMATSTSGLPVTYTSSNTAIASVTGNTVTIVGAGPVIITAAQPGNNNYNTAASVQQTLSVNKLSQAITFNALTIKSLGDANFALTATASSGLAVSYTSSNTAVATVSGNIVTIIGNGSANITASQSGNATYSAATAVIQALTVGKAAQTITFNALPAKLVGDASFALTATATSGLQVSYTSSNTAVATINAGIVTIVGSGLTNITASQAGNATYNAATAVVQTLNVGRSTQTITFATLPAKTFGDADFALSATSTNTTIPVNYSSGNTAVATIINGSVHIVGAGTATITASQAGNTNYNAAADVIQTLAVNKAAQTITFTAPPAKTVGDADFTLAAVSSSGLPVSYTSSTTGVATISGNTVRILGVGTTVITATQAGDANYIAATQVVQLLRVGKADQTITIAPLAAQTYGAADFNLVATASSGLPVNYTSTNTAIATVSGSTVHIVGAGVTSIIASQPGNAIYNAASTVQQTLTINTAPITLTATANSKTYGSADPALSYTFTGTLAAGDGFTGALTRAPGETVNTYAINQGTLALSSNYTLTYSGAIFTIGKKLLTVTADDKSKTYGTVNPAFTLAYSGFVNNETTSSLTNLPTVGTNATAASNAGNYALTPGGGIAANYDFNYVDGTLTINKAIATASAGNFTRVYGVANPAFAITYSGFLNGDTEAVLTTPATIVTNATINSPTGTYTITPAGAVANNYQFNYTAGTLTITKATRSITFNSMVKTYGDADFDGAATAPGGDAVIYTSDNAAVATIVNGKIHIAGAGNANITASLPDNANYFATSSVTQPLIVNKANQTIRFSAIPMLSRGAVYDLSIVSASSGLPVKFATSDPKIVAVSSNGQSLSAMNIGVVSITASQTGNANYNAAVNVMQNASVQDPNGNEIIVHQALSPNGDGINDVLYIEGISEHPQNRVTLINRNGVKIYEVNDYDNSSRAFNGHSNITGAMMQPGTYFYLIEYVVDGVGRHKTGYFVLKF